MTNNRFSSHCLICALILIVGFSFALVLPRLASSQGLATHSEVIAQDNVPEATRYYVAKTGSGSPGTSWVNAFKNVQDALGAASSGDEIWVAKGVYTPGNTVSDTFKLVSGVGVYGGFAGNETQRTQRDWEANLTILSGDIDGDDTNTDGVVMTTTHIVGDNSHHVVLADGTTGSTVMDGFTITAGQANGGNVYDKYGGGFYCDGSGIGNECSPSLNYVTFSGNSADVYGGAMFNNGRKGSSSPSLSNVTFSGNSANYGGAIFNHGQLGSSSPSLNNVTFSDNSAGTDGGAMYNNGAVSGSSSPSLSNVIFSGNSADKGGAMYNNGSNSGSSSPSLTNVVFSGNWADNGGAMYNFGDDAISSPNLINVVFSGNFAEFDGGAMFNNGSASGTSSPILTNATFSGNSAGGDGGAMFNYGVDGTCEPELRNSILWNNQNHGDTGTISATIFNVGNTIKLTNSLAQGTGGMYWTSDSSFVDGGGNIDTDPMFVMPIDPSTAPTTTGNLRLQSGSPAIDAGDNTFVSVPFDLDNKQRIVDGDMDGTPTVDMGAYEKQIEEVYMPLIFR